MSLERYASASSANMVWTRLIGKAAFHQAERNSSHCCLLFPPCFLSPPNLLQIHGPLCAGILPVSKPVCSHLSLHQSTGTFKALAFGWEKAGAVWATPSLSWRKFWKAPGSGMGPGWPFFNGLQGTWKEAFLPFVLSLQSVVLKGGCLGGVSSLRQAGSFLCLPCGTVQVSIAVSMCWVMSQHVLSKESACAEWIRELLILLGVFVGCHPATDLRGSHSETVIFSQRISSFNSCLFWHQVRRQYSDTCVDSAPLYYLYRKCCCDCQISFQSLF